MAEEDVNVRVSHGALRGRKVTAKAGNSYFSFQGIPYAKPPVGPLRFQVAQPVEPWDGVRDALKEGPSCPQIEWIKKLPYFGDEDCLYVNVYSPQLPSSQTLDYPVMVWIHGGGFEVGNGDEDIYGPEYLVGGNVVLVTFNYRLGIFGFLRVDDASVPGNVGLKDQVAALRWVKENIAVFGGDPNNVTIFGESAGGASVHYHLLSPMSQGLFHKAILQSGCALNPWASSVESQELTFKLAKELGSDTSNVQELLSFLKTVPARDLVEKEDELKQMAGEIFPRFRPTPEEYSPGPGDEIFLPAHPKEMMEKRQFNSVPVMMGATSNEGIIILDMMGILETPVNLDKIMELAGKLLPKDLKSSSTEVERAVKEYIVGYKNVNQSQFTSKQQRGEEKNTAILPEFGSQPSLVLNRNHYQSLANLASDVAVHIGEDKTINILSEGPSPVFFYVFGFDGKLNFYKHFVKASEFTGASHLDDVGYLFATPFFKVPQVAPDSPEAITRKRMVKLWTDFAKTGNPTPDPDPLIGVKWPAYKTSERMYLNINDTISIAKGFNRDRLHFWSVL